MLIYNLFPTLVGRFSDWISHIERASSMGFNWIFLNPIQLPGVSGSLYSIKDYFSLNPLLTDPESPLAPEDQLRETIKTARENGIEMMIDLVINHSAIDSPLIHEHPEWYVHDKNGKVASPYAMDGEKKVIWGDLARLDHKKTSDPEGLYGYFRGLVDHLISLGFKGFRCDAAYQVPQSVWNRLISDTRESSPEAVFVAETLGCSPRQTTETASAGFDYIFNSSKWWDYKGQWLMEQYKLFSAVCPSISFPESHDTRRMAEEFDGNINVLKRSYLFSALFSSGVMIPIGFEYGFKKRLHVVNTRPGDWESTEIDICSFIARVNKVKMSYEIFNTDAPTTMGRRKANRNILMINKQTHRETAMVAINMDSSSSQRLISDNIEDMLPGALGAVKCLIPGQEASELTGKLDIALNPGDGIILIAGAANDR